MRYDRDTVKEWAGDSQWRALRADYQRFRQHGQSGWGSEGFWALAIYRAQRALGKKSQRRWLWSPTVLLLRAVRKALQIVTGLDLNPDADIGAGMLIAHGSQVRVIAYAKIGVDCTLSHVCTIGAGVASGRPIIGDHVYVAPHACIIGSTIGDGATIAACSLVLSDVPAGRTAIGVPARIASQFDVQPFRTDRVTPPSSNEARSGAGTVASSRRE